MSTCLTKIVPHTILQFASMGHWLRTVCLLFPGLQDDYVEALGRLHLTVSRAYRVNPEINFEVFIHKVDGLSDDHKIETQRDIHQRANDDLADASLEKLHLRSTMSRHFLSSPHTTTWRNINRVKWNESWFVSKWYSSQNLFLFFCMVRPDLMYNCLMGFNYQPYLFSFVNSNGLEVLPVSTGKWLWCSIVYFKRKNLVMREMSDSDGGNLAGLGLFPIVYFVTGLYQVTTDVFHVGCWHTCVCEWEATGAAYRPVIHS